MAAIVTDNFRVRDANDFIASVSEDSMYMFIAKTDPWPNDIAPPAPTDSLQETEYTHWDDMIAAKKMVAANVSNLIPRVDWLSGTIYTEYDPTDADLHRTEFYVKNSNHDVYKCIDNNGGLASTVEPTGTPTAIFTTGDGYSWKYMYSMTGDDVLYFLSSQFMPVRNTASNADNDGPGQTPYPPGGHGTDNIKELGAYFVGINVRFEFDEGGDFTVVNDYRKIGLVQNPYLYGTTTVATDATIRQSTVFDMSGISGTFTPDETIEGATPADTARVIEHNILDDKLYVQVLTGIFSPTNSITGDSSGATATIDAITDPDLEPYTGDLLYVETRNPVNRDQAQVESVSVILQF